jgi:hypothetical protein
MTLKMLHSTIMQRCIKNKSDKYVIEFVYLLI